MNGCNAVSCKGSKKMVRWQRRRRRTARKASSSSSSSMSTSTSTSTTRRSVEMKVKKLQMLIPGGKGLKADRLFLRTADYILHLRLQVNVLQALIQDF
nr:transcription factor PAR1-like [Ziziphus jujuba var. spinosa]